MRKKLRNNIPLGVIRITKSINSDVLFSNLQPQVGGNQVLQSLFTKPSVFPEEKVPGAFKESVVKHNLVPSEEPIPPAIAFTWFEVNIRKMTIGHVFCLEVSSPNGILSC